MQLVLISGLSGSGKSIALHMLEDSGFYSVDNLPAQLLGDVMRFLKDSGYSRVAVAVDMRSGETVASLPQQLAGFGDRAGTDVGKRGCFQNTTSSMEGPRAAMQSSTLSGGSQFSLESLT